MKIYIDPVRNMPRSLLRLGKNVMNNLCGWVPCLARVSNGVDQSNKIEKTNKDSVVGFSNHIFGSILMRAKDKREVERIFQRIGKSKVFVYKLFAILIFLLIKQHLRQIDEIVIDQEYPGKENLIKSFLLREIKKVKSDFLPQSVIFRRIGKKSKAHFVAYGVITNKKSPDKIVGVKEILRFLIK